MPKHFYVVIPTLFPSLFCHSAIPISYYIFMLFIVSVPRHRAGGVGTFVRTCVPTWYVSFAMHMRE